MCLKVQNAAYIAWIVQIVEVTMLQSVPVRLASNIKISIVKLSCACKSSPLFFGDCLNRNAARFTGVSVSVRRTWRVAALVGSFLILTEISSELPFCGIYFSHLTLFLVFDFELIFRCHLGKCPYNYSRNESPFVFAHCSSCKRSFIELFVTLSVMSCLSDLVRYSVCDDRSASLCATDNAGSELCFLLKACLCSLMVDTSLDVEQFSSDSSIASFE